MFEGPETFVVGNNSIKRCNIHSENKFVLAKEIKVTNNFKRVLAAHNFFYVAGDKFGGTTPSRNDGSTYLIRFVDFR